MLTLLVTACASTPSEEELAAEQAVVAEQQRIAAEAELEAQRLREEQQLAEERAREVAARAEAERQAAAEAERRQQEQAAAARERAQQAPSVEERARVVARQQERIAELRAQIAANQSETTNLESANATLLQAITAAEDLVATLTEEQEKYASKDPVTGATVEALSKERIDELNAELERLQNQAAALSQQP
jgi:hypothetical protein